MSDGLATLIIGFATYGAVRLLHDLERWYTVWSVQRRLNKVREHAYREVTRQQCREAAAMLADDLVIAEVGREFELHMGNR